MVASVLLEVPKCDLAFFEELRDQNHPVEIVETDHQQGSIEYLDVVVTLVGALTPIIVAYLAKPAKPPAKKRVVIDGQRKTFEGYTAKDISNILDSIDDEP